MPDIRDYRPGDEEGICKLFELCHKRPLALDVWRWRYAARAEGLPVTQVAVDNGGIVGHLSALPALLSRAGGSIPAGLWVDLMVAPGHRNLDTFLDLAEANRKKCAAMGLELLFAFPNNNSFHVMKRMLDWRHVGDILALEKIAPFSLKAAAAPQNRLIKELGDLGPKLERLWREVKPGGALAGSRSATWLSWRYRSKPRAKYRAWAAMKPGEGIAGWLVAKTFDGPGGRVGDVLDFWAEPGPDAEALLDAAFQFFTQAEAVKASIWAPAHAPLRGLLESRGFAEDFDRTHLAARWTADHRADLPERFDEWLMAKGDSDIF